MDQWTPPSITFKPYASLVKLVLVVAWDKDALPYAPHPVEVQVGGATIFVLGMERYEKI